MLRNGFRLRSHNNYSGFISDTLSSCDDNPDDVFSQMPVQPAIKQKKGRKKRMKKLEEVSQTTSDEPVVDIKKKMKKKAVSPAKRKVLRPKRRLGNNHEVITVPVTIKSPKQKEVSPKIKAANMRICRASPPLLKLNEFQDIVPYTPKHQGGRRKSPRFNIEDKENEEFLTASDFSSPLKSPQLKTNQVFPHDEDQIETLIGSQMFEKKFNNDTFEIDDSNEKFVEGTFEILKENKEDEISGKKGGSRRDTFDIKSVGNELKSFMTQDDEEKTLTKLKKRDTYEIDNGKASTSEVETPEEPNKRDTFEIPEDCSYLMSAKKKGKKHVAKIGKNKNSQMSLKTSPKTSKKKTFNVNLQSGKMKVRFSESESSALTDSEITSASKLFQRARRLNPPSDTSTPNTSIKHTSPKSKKVSTDSKRLPTSRVKRVPNYAAIHQKAFNKMEGLDDHLARKNDRANALLSGIKVPVGAAFSPSSKEGATSKKQLFPSISSDAANKSISFRNGIKWNQRKSSPLAHKHLAAGDATVSTLESPKKHRLKKAVSFNVKSPVKAVPIVHAKTPKPNREQVWKAVGTRIPRSTAPAMNNSVMRNISIVKKLDKDEKVDNKVDRVFSKGIDKTLKREILRKDIKSVSTKSKASTTSVESRRDHIKGVRSNRRFDLLMNMRKM